MTAVTQPPTSTGEPRFLEQTWDLSYRHSLGETVAIFLDGVSRRELKGRLCPVCERVLFPARGFCDRCHEPTTEWSDVQPHGRLEMFTIVVENFPGIRVKAPYVLAYALLEGADTAVVGYLRGLDLSDPVVAAQSLTMGMPIDVHFAEQPEGQVTDFWFQVRPA